MKIRIDYSPETREALINTDEVGKAWSSVIRACQDVPKSNVILVDTNNIKLAWWLFLLAREPIAYSVSRFNISIEFSEPAKELLKKALNKQNSYLKKTETKAINEAELKKILDQNGFTRILTKEQIRNVLKLIPLSACATFSVPGAGKTTEALAYYCYKKSEDTRLLVVCPKNAFAVWEEQVRGIFSGKYLEVVRLKGAGNISNLLNRRPDVCLITYHQVPYVEQELADYLSLNDVFVFLDESHKMKRGDSGVIGSSILSLSYLPEAKCIMSGTPLPNGIADLLPQFQFLYPEIAVTVENVKDMIKPIYVRTTKKELNIPSISRFLTSVEMSSPQRDLYQLMTSEYRRQFNSSISFNDRRKLRSLGRSALRLIQFVSNPSLLARRADFEHRELLRAVLEEGDSPKLEYVTKRARELARQGQKVIVWSSFVLNVELIAERLIDLGADYIHGGVDAGSEEEENTRERKIKRFHDDPNAWVMVANPAACSEGISLHTVCHHAIYLDRNYNAAQYLQSEDRIHRLGLKPSQKTTVEVLYCPGTVDESVNNRLKAKVEIMREVLDDPELNIDPIAFDPDNDEEFSLDDAADFLKQLQSDAGV